MLASPQTVPLFVKKYQQRRLKQYRRREPVHKGMGDIICCLMNLAPRAATPPHGVRLWR